MLKNKSSLPRIYRPSVFKDVAGHENIVQILQKELKDNAFGHAFLFAGQKGTGKTSIARIFAKAVNCSNRKDGEPCEECTSCQLANKGKSPDIYEIDAASNNGVEEIRNIKNNVSTVPLQGQYKIYIIDEVHMLSKGAFNALLKTLEEPPLHALFILATTEFAKIPPTIVSRCQTFNFKKIDRHSLIKRLQTIAQIEGFEIEDATVEEIYFLSDGSLRDALNILEQLMIMNDDKISLTSLKKIFYVASKKEKLQIIQDVLNHQPQDLIRYFENVENQGMDFDVFTLNLMEILKEIIEFKITNDPSFLKLLTLAEYQEIKGSLEQYFLLADELSAVYAKTKGTNVNANYLLISLLKAMQSKFSDAVQVVKKPVVLSPELVAKTSEILDEEENELLTASILFSESMPNQEPKLVQEEIKMETQPHLDSEKTSLAKNLTELIGKKLKLIENFGLKKSFLVVNKDLINLLVGAVKEKRDLLSDQIDQWFMTSSDLALVNPQLANTFIAFYGGKVSAVSDCEILIRFETEPGANLLKKELLDRNYQQQLSTELKGNYVFYVIDDDQWENVKKEYLFQKKNKSLPVHQHIISDSFYQKAMVKEKKPQSTEEFLKVANELFGEDLEIGD